MIFIDLHADVFICQVPPLAPWRRAPTDCSPTPSYPLARPSLHFSPPPPPPPPDTDAASSQPRRQFSSLFAYVVVLIAFLVTCALSKLFDSVHDVSADPSNRHQREHIHLQSSSYNVVYALIGTIAAVIVGCFLVGLSCHRGFTAHPEAPRNATAVRFGSQTRPLALPVLLRHRRRDVSRARHSRVDRIPISVAAVGDQSRASGAVAPLRSVADSQHVRSTVSVPILFRRMSQLDLHGGRSEQDAASAIATASAHLPSAHGPRTFRTLNALIPIHFPEVPFSEIILDCGKLDRAKWDGVGRGGGVSNGRVFFAKWLGRSVAVKIVPCRVSRDFILSEYRTEQELSECGAWAYTSRAFTRG